MPATRVVPSLLRKSGFFQSMPVSITATMTPAPLVPKIWLAASAATLAELVAISFCVR